MLWPGEILDVKAQQNGRVHLTRWVVYSPPSEKLLFPVHSKCSDRQTKDPTLLSGHQGLSGISRGQAREYHMLKCCLGRGKTGLRVYCLFLN